MDRETEQSSETEEEEGRDCSTETTRRSVNASVHRHTSHAQAYM